MYEHYQQATHVAACSGGTSGLVAWPTLAALYKFHWTKNSLNLFESKSEVLVSHFFGFAVIVGRLLWP